MTKLLAHLPKRKINTEIDIKIGLIKKYGWGQTREKAARQKAKFALEFMQCYTELLVKYFRGHSDTKIYVAHFDNVSNRGIVRQWFDKMTTSTEVFPFPIDCLLDKQGYKNGKFWGSVIETLIAKNDHKTIHIFTQTTNGIFRYVQRGKYAADLRKDISDVSSKLTLTDFTNIVGTFCVLAYELSAKKKFKKTKKFYKYTGYIDIMDDVPVFKKSLIRDSALFRAILVDFTEFYYAIIKFFKLSDFMQYDKLLEFIGELSVDLSYDGRLFKIYNVDDPETFLVKITEGILDA